MTRKATKGSKYNGDGIQDPLHPSLEAFAQALAGILVDRHLERKQRKTNEHCGASVKTPGDLSRRGDG